MAEERKAGQVPHLFHYLGLAACGYMTFMGLIYISNGNFFSSAILTGVILIVFGLLVHYLCIWKAKVQKNQMVAPSKVPEIMLGLFYFLVFALASVASIEFMVVDFSKKDTIKRAGMEKIADLENLQRTYQTAINAQKQKLRTEAEIYSAGYKTGGANKQDYEQRLNNLLGDNTAGSAERSDNYNQAIEDAIAAKQNLQQSNYGLDSLNKKASSLMVETRKAFENWNQLQIGFKHKQVTEFINLYLNRANQKNLPAFSFQPQSQQEALFNLGENLQSAGGKIVFYLIILIVIHLCILALYIATPRPHQTLRRNTEYKPGEIAEGSIRQQMNS